MSARVQVDKYFAALERLKVRKKPINNDAVALEAGCGRGSIKKSRPAYAELITAIEAAAKDQAEGEVASDPVPALRQAIGEITRRLDQSLDRELARLDAWLDEAIEEGNRLPVGLGAYLFTGSMSTVHKVQNRLKSGMLGVNHFALALPETPFGGVRDSGFGSEGGLEGIEAYLSTMTVTTMMI